MLSMASLLFRTFVLMLALASQAATGHEVSIGVTGYGRPATLTCVQEYHGTFKYWLLPDLTTQVNRDTKLDGMELLSNWSLYIPVVESHHLGVYLCLVKENVDEDVYHKTTVHLDLWQKYRHNLLVGGVAAAAGLVVFSLVFCSGTIASRKKAGKGGDSGTDGTKAKVSPSHDGMTSENNSNRHWSSSTIDNHYSRGMDETDNVSHHYVNKDGSVTINTNKYTHM